MFTISDFCIDICISLNKLYYSLFYFHCEKMIPFVDLNFKFSIDKIEDFFYISINYIFDINIQEYFFPRIELSPILVLTSKHNLIELTD